MLHGFDESPLKADINISASGDNTIIAAPGAGVTLAIDFLILLPTTAVTLQFKDGTTAFGGALPLATQQALTIENATRLDRGIVPLTQGNAFVINLGSAVQVSGWVVYRKLDS